MGFRARAAPASCVGREDDPAVRANMGQDHSVSRPEGNLDLPTWAEDFRGYRHKRSLWIGVDKSGPSPSAEQQREAEEQA
jgi:hypothetical protein